MSKDIKDVVKKDDPSTLLGIDFWLCSSGKKEDVHVFISENGYEKDRKIVWTRWNKTISLSKRRDQLLCMACPKGHVLSSVSSMHTIGHCDACQRYSHSAIAPMYQCTEKDVCEEHRFVLCTDCAESWVPRHVTDTPNSSTAAAPVTGV